MTESAKSALHEVMEYQTPSMAMAGIVCRLTAKMSVLAAGNPVGSSWDHEKTIMQNFKMSGGFFIGVRPRALQTRFRGRKL